MSSVPHVPSSPRPRAGLLGALLVWALILCPSTARAQAGGLEDGQVAVVTSDGLFLVGPGPQTQQLLGAADFGLAELCEPSITWIDQADVFVVTSSRSCDARPGLFRVQVHPGPVASVTRLAAPALVGGSPVDSVYDPAHDRLWILDGLRARLYAWPEPLLGSSARLELVHELEDEDPDDVGLYGLAEPGALLVAQRHVLRKLLPDGSSEVLWEDQGGGLLVAPRDVATHGLKDEIYILRPAAPAVDILAGPSLVVPLNKWPDASCTLPVVLGPADLDWDYDSKRLVVLAAEGVQCLQGGALADEPNHVVGLRALVPLGAPNAQPILLTPSPSSGITGLEPDLAQVRFDRPALIHYGQATAAAGGSAPTSITTPVTGKLEPGSSVWAILEQAPPSAPAWFVVGLQDQPLQLQGAALFPALDLALPVTLDAEGGAQLQLAIPSDPLLAGLELRSQWLVAPPGGGASASWATWMRLAD